MLTGPSNFEAWRACWRVFRTAMLLLGASLPGPLDEYEENIRVLSNSYGTKAWGLISHADEVMRSEQWGRLRGSIEELRRRGHYLEVWDAQRPWQGVIRDSARDTRFWDTNVRHLAGHCTVAAVDQGADANGNRPPATSGGSGGGGGGRQPPGGGDGGGGGRRPRPKPRARKSMASKQERADGRRLQNRQGRAICFAWNRAKDGCSQRCPNQRAHQCEWCLSQAHRGIDCPKKKEG